MTRRRGGPRTREEQQRINREGMALVRRVESVAARLIDCGLSIRTFYPWNTEPPYNGTREELLAGLEFAEEIADDAERAQAEAGQR